MAADRIRTFGKWLTRRPKRWAHLQNSPRHQIATLLLAIFFIFTVPGFFIDLMDGATAPYLIVLINAAFSGTIAMAFFLSVTTLPVYCLLFVFILQLSSSSIFRILTRSIRLHLHPSNVPLEKGIHFAAISILVTVLLSYVCFVRYMRYAGKESFRLKNELELAHAIQKTLVPVLARTLPAFEIYGLTQPSEKVGGDLVDALELSDGGTVAYLADVAGHGLPAGILMGMLKTAARTALRDRSPGEGAATLSLLMERLNFVLPEVKEQHMFATFTALRLNADGSAFYGLAASPPLLHWHADGQRLTQIEEEQFPLGLLPVPAFPAHALALRPGDLLLVVTDGILEVCPAGRRPGNIEFGGQALSGLLARNAALPLPELAAAILQAAREYGKQYDDQTLLLVRRT